jgi:glycosyltransferase involved in cell wall biosynthesis
MRYAWDLQHEYLRGGNGRGLRGFALRWLLHYLRLWDSRTAHGVDLFLANSSFVAGRIRKCYGRSAEVLYPPVDIEQFRQVDAKENFYLCFGRLMPYKRVDLAVETFKALTDHRLLIIGDGPEYKRLKRSATPNVEFLGYQPDQIARSYLERATALIFPAKEDFGLTPVEAQACGTPVIAFAGGGALETVRALGSSNPTGILFPQQSVSALTEAINAFERNREAFLPKNCRDNAERFSVERFRKGFMDLVMTRYQQNDVASKVHA